MGLKLIFLMVSHAVSLLGLSRRESWWKDAEIVMLRHQLAAAERERPRARSRLTWPDRARLALLAGTLPAGAACGDAADRHSWHHLAVAPRHRAPDLTALRAFSGLAAGLVDEEPSAQFGDVLDPPDDCRDARGLFRSDQGRVEAIF